MSRILSFRARTALGIYVLVDLLCVAAGLGVPFFSILLGAPVGWYIARRLALSGCRPRAGLRALVGYAALASLITVAIMALVWGPSARSLFTPGVPLQALASSHADAGFVGWLMLVVLISPSLQLLMTLFAGQITLMVCAHRSAWSAATEPQTRA